MRLSAEIDERTIRLTRDAGGIQVIFHERLLKCNTSSKAYVIRSLCRPCRRVVKSIPYNNYIAISLGVSSVDQGTVTTICIRCRDNCVTLALIDEVLKIKGLVRIGCGRQGIVLELNRIAFCNCTKREPARCLDKDVIVVSKRRIHVETIDRGICRSNRGHC